MIDGKTLEQWHKEIDDKNIYNLWKVVFERLYPNQLYRNKNRSNSLKPSEYYLRIDVFQYVDGQEVFAAKFPYTIYLEEETQYKQSLKDQITIKFQALEKRNEVKEILNGVDLLIAVARLGLGFSNIDRYKKDLIKSGNTQQALVLKNAFLEWTQENDDNKAKEKTVKNNFKKILKGLVKKSNLSQDEINDLEQFIEGFL